MAKDYGVNIAKIERDTEMAKERFGLDYNIDPRSKFHLDTTKIAWHKPRVDAWLRGEKIAPITMDIALTQRCSYACTYCYAGLQENPATPATWETYSNFLDDAIAIGHAPGEGVKAISLVSDGESTENEYFFDFIMKGRANGIDMASGTNGLLLDRYDLGALVKELTYLRFNISAGEREAYAHIMGTTEKNFDRAINNVREAVRLKKENNGEGATIGLQMVLLPEYADQVLPLAMLGRELGVDYSFYKSPISQNLLKTAEALSTEDFSVQAKWSKMKTGRDRQYSKCFGPPLMLQTSGTCLVAPCGSFFSTDYERFHIGNFQKDRFMDIWKSDRYWEVMGHLGSDRFDPRKECETLCLQDKVNEALFDLKEKGIPLPDVSDKPTPEHGNFI